MSMETIIRRRRSELGLTQEEVARRLGVTAPAVNKWEKGTTCPDIALLAPLARLLGTDVNTLLGFQEDLTDQEIVQFSAEAAETIRRAGFAAGAARVREKLREYPSCDKLTYSMAMYLEGALMMSGLSGEEAESYQREIMALYVRMAESADQQIRDGAVYMLAGKAIQQGDYRRAEELLERLPKRNALDKCQLQAQLFIQQGKLEDAAEILERKCLTQANELQATLLSLLSLAQKEEDQAAAQEVAEIHARVVDLLGLWVYSKTVAPLELALGRRDLPGSLMALEDMLDSLLQPWNLEETRLYRHIAPKYRDRPSPGAEMLPGLLTELENNPQYRFLQNDPAFQRLLERYRGRTSQLRGENPTLSKTAPASPVER